jgi:hypothetical protein
LFMAASCGHGHGGVAARLDDGSGVARHANNRHIQITVFAATPGHKCAKRY